MDLTCLTGTFGEQSWADLARERAGPSVEAEGIPWVHVHGDSLAASRNRAAERADTEWLAVVDADDEICPGFAAAMEKAAGSGADLLTPAISYVRNGRPRPPMFWPEQDIRTGNYLIVSTLIRRELFFELGAFREVAMYEDWDLAQRALKAGAVVERVPEAVVRVHVNPRSTHRMGSTRRQKLAAHEQVCRLNFPEMFTDGVSGELGGSLAACPSPV